MRKRRQEEKRRREEKRIERKREKRERERIEEENRKKLKKKTQATHLLQARSFNLENFPSPTWMITGNVASLEPKACQLGCCNFPLSLVSVPGDLQLVERGSGNCQNLGNWISLGTSESCLSEIPKALMGQSEGLDFRVYPHPTTLRSLTIKQPRRPHEWKSVQIAEIKSKQTGQTPRVYACLVWDLSYSNRRFCLRQTLVSIPASSCKCTAILEAHLSTLSAAAQFDLLDITNPNSNPHPNFNPSTAMIYL